MSPVVRRCLAMTVGAAALLALLLAMGVPGAVLLTFAPALLCVGIHLVMGHGNAHGMSDTAGMHSQARSERPEADLAGVR